jgi:hypothetical protein
MCGIVGIVGDIGNKEKQVFKRLLELDTTRGPHSTGVISVECFKNEVRFDKRVGTPWDFFAKSFLTDARGNVNGLTKLLIGHNRWATQGAVNEENAHPFNFEHVVGVHNGTINCYRSMNFLKEKGGDHVVDSHRLYESINNIGLEETITNIDGAWSLVWYDKEEKRVNFFRNSQRPMNFAFSKGRKTMFFASEPWMIQVACMNVGIDVEGIHQTRTDIQYFIDLEGNNFANDKVKLRFFEEKIEGKKWPAATGGSVYTSPFVVGGGVKTGITGPTDSTTRHPVLDEVCDSKGLCGVYFDHKRSSIIQNWSGSKYSQIVLYTLVADFPVKVYVNNETHNIKELYEAFAECTGWFEARPMSVMKDGEGFAIITNFGNLSAEKGWDEVDWSDVTWPASETGDKEEKLDLDEIDEEQGKKSCYTCKHQPEPVSSKVCSECDDYLCNWEEGDGKEEEKKEEGLVQIAHGELVTVEEFTKLIKDESCALCGADHVDPKDADKILWTSYPRVFICPECASHPGNHTLFGYYNVGR